MPRRNQNQAEAPGQDSFLDVVANLVGILIILIIVVGAATQKAFVAQDVAAAEAARGEPGVEFAQDENNSANAEKVTEEQVEEAAAAARAVEAEIFQTAELLKKQEFETKFRRLERDKALALISAAERELAERRAALDTPEQELLDRETELANARRELSDLEKLLAQLAKQQKPKGVLEHLPTPMAKTVFGKEVHFRLAGNRLAHVPWDELIELLKADAPQKIHRLRDTASFTESLGPVDGFAMRYTMKKTEVTVPGRGTQQRAELDRFVVMPIDDTVGEPVDAALRPNSDFFAVVNRLHPDRATITIWVYPDSFQHYRTFKKLLFDRGFLTAARPLPDGYPIGGSPDGSRSAAE